LGGPCLINDEVILLKPKFKNIYKPIVRIDNKIRIGFESEALEIEDEDYSIEKFINALDGNKNIEELSRTLKITVDEVVDGISTLDEYLLLEDANNISNLNMNQQERYRANLNYFSFHSNLHTTSDTFQKKLTDSTVAILGIGGSSLISASLAGMGVGKIIGLDYDIVELSNLNRQFLYSEDDIGKLKTIAAEERLKRINNDIEIEMHNMKVMNAKDLLSIIDRADIVINAIDQPPITSSRWVNSACVHLNKTYLQGGVTNTRVVLQKIVPTISCFDCYLIQSLKTVEGFDKQIMSASTHNFSGRNTAYAPNIALMGSLFSTEISKYLLSLNEQEDSFTADINNFDGIDYKKFPILKATNCPTCSDPLTFNEPVSFNELIQLAQVEDVLS
jgi:molybdopterin-synthase adenylyltransferase